MNPFRVSLASWTLWGGVCGGILLGGLSPSAAEEYLAPGAQGEKAVSGCRFTEGPALDADGNLYFSDGPNDRIMRRSPDGTVSIFRQPCGQTNGMKFDAEGRLVMCQSAGAKGKRRVARIEVDGKEIVLAEAYEGKKLNAPNDLTIAVNGRIYFTDMAPPNATNLELPSAVYRIDAPGQVVRVIDNLGRPNGIVLTPDNKTLYVSDRAEQKLHRYDVAADGSLSNDSVVYDFSPDRGIDGMCLDAEGNIVAAAGQGATTGLFVVSPQGKLLLHKPVPEFATNVCFAGEDFRELFITASTSVYRFKTVKPGQKPLVMLQKSK